MKTVPPQRPKPATIRAAWWLFAIVLAVTVGLGLLIHPHAAFGVDGTFAFSAWFGFLACGGIVVFSKLLGLLLSRPDTYYDDSKDDPADPN